MSITPNVWPAAAVSTKVIPKDKGASLLEHVADTPHRLDATRRGRIGLDLAAQPAHVDVDCAGVADVFVTPHVAQQCFPPLQLTRIPQYLHHPYQFPPLHP